MYPILCPSLNYVHFLDIHDHVLPIILSITVSRFAYRMCSLYLCVVHIIYIYIYIHDCYSWTDWILFIICVLCTCASFTFYIYSHSCYSWTDWILFIVHVLYLCVICILYIYIYLAMAVVRELIQRGADLTLTNECGWTPLHVAVATTHVWAVEQLAEAGIFWSL